MTRHTSISPSRLLLFATVRVSWIDNITQDLLLLLGFSGSV